MNKQRVEMISFFPYHDWIIPIFMIITLALLTHFPISHSYKRVDARLEHTNLPWDVTLLHPLIRPLKIFIWILPLIFSIQIFGFHMNYEDFVKIFRPFRDLLFTFITLWFSLRFIRNMEVEHSHQNQASKKCLMTRFDEFGTSSLNFLIDCFTKTTKWTDDILSQQDIYMKTIKIIEKHVAKYALPTPTLHIPEGVLLK